MYVCLLVREKNVYMFRYVERTEPKNIPNPEIMNEIVAATNESEVC